MARGEYTLADPEDLPTGLSEDIRKALVKYLKRKKKSKDDWEHTSAKVPIYLCDLMRDMHDEGLPGTKIVNLVPVKSQATVYYHLRDDCSHDYRSQLTYDECGWIRMYAKKGAPSKTLAVLYDISQEAIARHATGRCSHDHGCKPIDSQELHNNGRAETPMTTSTCPECEESFEHAEYKEQRFCSNKCNAIFAAKKGGQAYARKMKSKTAD